MSAISTIVPDLDMNLMHRDVKLESGSNVTMRVWTSTSYSNSNITFSCPPPSTSVFIDRCVFMELPVTISYAGTTTGSALLQAGYDSLRCAPISSVTNSVQCTINNQTFVIQSSDIVPYLHHYFKGKKHTTYPSFTDKYAVYADGVTANNNPLGTYFNSLNGEMPRGAFPMIITNGATASTIQATIIEPIFLPPFHLEPEDGLGFSNVRTMDFVVNLNSQLNRMVSHAASLATLSSVSVTIGQPLLAMKYTTPKNPVPRTLVFGSQEINRYPTVSSTLASNASAVIQSTNMQLNAIPSHVFIFVRESDSNKTYASTDTFANISNISINFNNQSGILSSATEEQLYNISKANGLQDSWEEYHGLIANLGTKVGTSGSILKLCFGKDISIGPNDFPGKIGAYNLQLQVTANNFNQGASITTPTLFVIPVTPQKVIMHETGDITVELGVKESEAGGYVPYHAIAKHYGGSFKDFIGKVGKFLKPVNNFLKESKLISTIAKTVPFTQSIAPVIEKLGYGEDEAVGGRVMTRAQLKRKLGRL